LLLLQFAVAFSFANATLASLTDLFQLTLEAYQAVLFLELLPFTRVPRIAAFVLQVLLSLVHTLISIMNRSTFHLDPNLMMSSHYILNRSTLNIDLNLIMSFRCLLQLMKALRAVCLV